MLITNSILHEIDTTVMSMLQCEHMALTFDLWSWSVFILVVMVVLLLDMLGK